MLILAVGEDVEGRSRCCFVGVMGGSGADPFEGDVFKDDALEGAREVRCLAMLPFAGDTLVDVAALFVTEMNGVGTAEGSCRDSGIFDVFPNFTSEL